MPESGSAIISFGGTLNISSIYIFFQDVGTHEPHPVPSEARSSTTETVCIKEKYFITLLLYSEADPLPVAGGGLGTSNQ